MNLASPGYILRRSGQLQLIRRPRASTVHPVHIDYRLLASRKPKSSLFVGVTVSPSGDNRLSSRTSSVFSAVVSKSSSPLPSPLSGVSISLPKPTSFVWRSPEKWIFVVRGCATTADVTWSNRRGPKMDRARILFVMFLDMVASFLLRIVSFGGLDSRFLPAAVGLGLLDTHGCKIQS